MQVFYTNTQTSIASTATAQSISSVPVVIRKIIVGNPVNSGNVILFNESNAVANNTTNIVFKKVYGGTVAETSANTFDFRAASGSGGGSVEEDGIFCPGGASIVTDQTMAVT